TAAAGDSLFDSSIRDAPFDVVVKPKSLLRTRGVAGSAAKPLYDSPRGGAVAPTTGIPPLSSDAP
ncbi:MAG TPA: hypothetical protein VMW87_01235, partial [Spirochaetia bacterium]|nr:hypothetical protein [Spirochaetia bacterium]